MPRFLNTPERRTCRYDSRQTSEIVAGLYTDNFSECNIIIIYKRNDSGVRISMTHADRVVLPDQIQREFDWAGEGALAMVVAKDTLASEEIRRRVLGALVGRFEVRRCETTVFALSFNIGGDLSFYTRENLPLLVAHPREWQFQSVFILNLLFATYEPILTRRMRSPLEYMPPNYGALQNTSLIFDGASWQPLSEHDQALSPLATEFMAYFRERLAAQKGCSKSEIMAVAQGFFQSKGVLVEVHQSDQALMVTHALLLATENNYQKLFNDELQYMALLNFEWVKGYR